MKKHMRWEKVLTERMKKLESVGACLIRESTNSCLFCI